MIKLNRPDAPAELTDEAVRKLTEEFKRTDKNVWMKKYIRDKLLEMSNKKCCYCEDRLEVSSNYMEVEHFYPKSKHPDKVILWDNLLPSCKRCNINKGDHDTYTEPIIDPTRINPKDHIRLQNYRCKPKTPLGKKTIDVLYLNETSKLGILRWEIGERLQDTIENLLALSIEYNFSKATRTKNRIIRGLKQLQEDCMPASPFCATAGSILLKDDDYYKIKEILSRNSIWSDELEENEKVIKEYAFDS